MTVRVQGFLGFLGVLKGFGVAFRAECRQGWLMGSEGLGFGDITYCLRLSGLQFTDVC